MSDHGDSTTAALTGIQEPMADADPTQDVTVAGQGCDLPWCGTGPLPASTTGRLMMPVDWLTAHPGNVRTDLDLDPEFLASVAENGVEDPLRITIETDEEGNATGYRVIDGHAAWPQPSGPRSLRCLMTW
jgi:hypothetical protein